LSFISVVDEDEDDQLSGGLLGGRLPAIIASARKMITSSARTPMWTQASVLRYVQAGLGDHTLTGGLTAMATPTAAPVTAKFPALGLPVSPVGRLMIPHE